MASYETAAATGSTRFCLCYRLTRRDGVVMGFTDHDTDLTLDGLTCQAAAALTASEASAKLGTSADEMEARGALSSEAITEADLFAGLYDGAEVEVWEIDWSDAAARRLLGRFTIGQVERGALAFRAELRSLTAGLSRKRGRVHTSLCDARFGDARCQITTSAPGYSATATLTAVDGLNLAAAGLDAFAAGAFGRGRLVWLTGANAGTESDIRLSRIIGGVMTLSLWHVPAGAVSVGDTATAIVGCDKTYATCSDRFGNVWNFRGFPHMPGETFAGEYAVQGDPTMNGGSRF